MFDDPIVAEVRHARDGLARKFNYDVQAICADLMRRQGETSTVEELRTGTGGKILTRHKVHAAGMSQAAD